MIDEDIVVVRGLKNVAAAETRISFVDPNGQLYYSGYNIDDLAERVSYEEVIYLLWNNELPNDGELYDLRSILIPEMKLPDQVIEGLESTSPKVHPMDVLRTQVSHLQEYDLDYGIEYADNEFESANRRRAIQLVAKTPTIVAALRRIRAGEPIITPDTGLSFAENFLYMFRGAVPDEQERETIRRYMVLHAEHGLNASTFAARVTASTGADMYSAITSAISTLIGQFHGGASEKVMAMLNEINGTEEVKAYIQGILDDGNRIMGFGHRVYKNEDPRSKHLREMAEKLCRRTDENYLCEKAHRIENVVREKKGIFPNVDFYAAIVMHTLGVPIEYFTAFFASSRVSGWTTHVMEQYKDRILIRPTSKYTGKYGREFIPIEER